ncbi:hypothetical protein [Xenorhabdus bovienii]|uniref:Uncharacterized protein n=1 Tax=Xenorhabdus bovienii str. feltiae Moldova TaxID=1398200 RepID=A0A077NV80_XENBV|nr:hypothetical protein [Xenorhabdus bovienii]CDG89404.1 conserved hypothetical protein [Xenorhabdus bovienii str. feltiae France]CDG90670.1 conserved hypothetical protein [Xenorhabdus bovienii str. feltiae Florida]CDH02263.1 conserved hypothetical protein [Xenorhabdus bovienii str. feltiae Moldova]
MNVFLVVLRFLLPLVFFFSLGIGLWALGQGLRRKGHGERLDTIGERIKKFQTVTGRIFSPLYMTFIGVGRALNHIPLFGNKNSRVMWDILEKNKNPAFRKETKNRKNTN